MKTHIYRGRNLFILIATCFFLNGFSPEEAQSSTNGAPPAYGAARLVVHRVPDLGNNVIVNLWIDGVMVEPLTYGRSYDGPLSSGRHVLTLLPSPNAKWRVPSQMILNARRGQTYSFTATGDGSGHLILLRDNGLLIGRR